MMNPSPEFIELARFAISTTGGAIVLQKSIQKFAGAATDELIDYFHQAIEHKKHWKQLQREVSIFPKAYKLLESAGLDPESVPLKALMPMLEGVRFEEDESMQNKWAALLANAASGEMDVAQLPSFSDILKSLAPIEAKLLDVIYGKPEWFHSPLDVTEDFGFNEADAVRVVTENLIRQRLIRGGILHHEGLTYLSWPEVGIVRGIVYENRFVSTWEWTTFGSAFVQACKPPQTLEQNHTGVDT